MADDPTEFILIIDDEEGVTEALSDNLSDDFIVQTSNFSLEALDLLEETKFDLVLTDWRMPGATAIDIINKTKACQPDTPCVVMSGLSELDDKIREAKKAGAVGYIGKPFGEANALIEKLHRFIELSKA